MKKRDYYYDFLPSNIEIIEKNPSPLGGTIIYILSFFIIASLIMSMIFKIDVMITAGGIVENETGINVVNTNESKKIIKINYKTGDTVKKDDVILELEDNTSYSIKDIQNKMNRLEVELKLTDTKISGKKNITHIKNSKLSKEIKSELSSSYDYYWENLNKENQEYNKSIKEVDDELSGLYNETDNILTETRINTLKERRKSLVSERELKEKNNQLSYMKERNQTNQSIDMYKNQLETLKKQSDSTKIKSPINGQIIEMNYLTIGEFVKSGDPILKVIPDSQNYIIKANIKNSNISQIKENQEVKLKIDAYDYQVYGFLEGKVKTISEQSILNEKTGALEYPIEIEINSNDESKIKLKSGMTVSMDIKVKKESVFDYMTSPIRKTIDEAF